MKKLLVALALALFGCGGGPSGGGASEAPLPTADHLAPGKVFGFYGDCPSGASCFKEFKGYVSFYHTPPWEGDPGRAALYVQSGYGYPTILSLPEGIVFGGQCPVELRQWLSTVLASSSFDWVIGVYPVDEPTGKNKARPVPYSREQIEAATKCVREALPLFNIPSRLYVIYGCKHPWDGIEYFNVISCDDYTLSDSEVIAFTKKLLALGKDTMMVSGGACPWNHDPRRFTAFINSQPLLIGLWGFTWFDNYEPGMCGIRTGTSLPLYQSLFQP